MAQPVSPASIDRSEYLPPPRTFGTILKQLGPGLIVSASIVGSGELIASTTLGAQVGFAALWLIVLSCVIKVVVQTELGRFSISTGETTFQALDRIPGPRWRASWVVWAWMFMLVGVTFQIGGILGGVAQVFNLTLPYLPTEFWTLLTAILAIALLLRGSYAHIESTTTYMVVVFTFITIACAVALAWTPYAVRPEQIIEGFKFQLPQGGLAVAFAAFGITGVGATELVYYPYWCLEKGYARHVGPNDGSTSWIERARGWVHVMQIDALASMVIYTLATIAFYLLGASVLHGNQTIPSGYGMISTLSSMYTSTLGEWAFYLFLFGAFFVLFSTIFAATASNCRVIVDFLGLVRFIKVKTAQERLVWWRRWVLLFLSLCTVWYLMLGEPVFMVIIGGIAQACLLPVIGFSTVFLRYKSIDPAIRPTLSVDILLWVASTMMLAFAIYSVILRLTG